MDHRTALALVVLLVVSVTPTAAAAGLTRFPVTVDVSLRVEVTAEFDSISGSGCSAPAERATVRYTLDYESDLPGVRSGVRPGVATLTPIVSGTTPSRGEPGGARQRGRAGQWDLQVGYPDGCSRDAPPPVPPWATSPTCRPVAGAVVATLQQTRVGGGGDGELSPLGRDGILMVRRTGSAATGPGCLRFFSQFDSDSEGAVLLPGQRQTLMTFPVRNLSGRLLTLSAGGARSRPSFTSSFSIGGRCDGFSATPGIGRTDLTLPPFQTPLQALWISGGTTYDCRLSGRGVVIVRRAGPVTRMRIPG